jgi:hypothetical protein
MMATNFHAFLSIVVGAFIVANDTAHWLAAR